MSNEDDLILMGAWVIVVLAVAGVPIMAFLTGREIGRNSIEPEIVKVEKIVEVERIVTMNEATTEPIESENLELETAQCLESLYVLAEQRDKALKLADNSVIKITTHEQTINRISQEKSDIYTSYLDCINN
jgi:hypothetical protein